MIRRLRLQSGQLHGLRCCKGRGLHGRPVSRRQSVPDLTLAQLIRLPPDQHGTVLRRSGRQHHELRRLRIRRRQRPYRIRIGEHRRISKSVLRLHLIGVPRIRRQTGHDHAVIRHLRGVLLRHPVVLYDTRALLVRDPRDGHSRSVYAHPGRTAQDVRRGRVHRQHHGLTRHRKQLRGDVRGSAGTAQEFAQSYVECHGPIRTGPRRGRGHVLLLLAVLRQSHRLELHCFIYTDHR